MLTNWVTGSPAESPLEPPSAYHMCLLGWYEDETGKQHQSGAEQVNLKFHFFNLVLAVLGLGCYFSLLMA